jgi:putative sterol carrier protein
MPKSGRQTPKHSREYLGRILRVASATDPHAFTRGAGRLEGLALHITVEAQTDESFYLVGAESALVVRARRPSGEVSVAVRLSPEVVRSILEGEETPVEAFFLGHLRARGSTRNLYALHAFLIALAEIAVASHEIQELIEEFQSAKGSG